MHGGRTRFPIVLLLASVVFDFVACVTVALMTGGGFSGGEMSVSAATGTGPAFAASSKPAAPEDQSARLRPGQRLFVKNCAHCHGADAHGDEGPDLHNLDWSDAQIATRIRNGKKGQMPAFAEKFSPAEIREVTAYLRTLK